MSDMTISSRIGIDRRVRHLRKELLEIIEQRLRLVGETGQRRIGAHGADRLFALRRHGAEDHSEVFVAVSESALAAEQRLGVGMVHARRFGQLIDGDLIFLEPLRVGLPRRQLLLDLFVGDDAAFDRINEKHFPRLQAALLSSLARASISSTPASEAITTRSSLVTT